MCCGMDVRASIPHRESFYADEGRYWRFVCYVCSSRHPFLQRVTGAAKPRQVSQATGRSGHVRADHCADYAPTKSKL